MKLDISPNMGQALGALVTGIGALSGAGALLTPLFGEGTTQKIVSGISLASVVLGPFFAVLFRGSDTTPGPWATPDKPSTSTK